MRFSSWFAVLFLQTLALSCQSLRHGFDFNADTRILTVGEELRGETLPLKSGRRFYRLAGLKESAWYEIPASFDIRLEKDVPEIWLGRNRRLLNTEKMIFKADKSDELSNIGGMYALVTVEAAGVIAKPGLPERELVVYNIVCDELLFGIPHKAWWVGIAALLCLILASVIPYFFPFRSVFKNGSPQSKQPIYNQVFMNQPAEHTILDK
ncbi:hypothetical protein IHE45_15G092600 [Dioscorea alata]|uniref:Uncharacterized protein n=1 Tax=Dioscorea alata TaxID=55571 RepID=A0ACB7UN30_DIOAL|nr:hypothetical protein IHE45_15G092600 [Dioscorea alata]